MDRITNWIHKEIVTPARGLNGDQIALSVAVGIWGGVFPVPAMSTFATFGLTSFVFGALFNPAMITIAVSLNLAVTPVQVSLVPFFMGFRSFVGFNGTCNVSDLVESVKTVPFLESIATFGTCLLWGVLFWALLAPFSIFGIRVLFRIIASVRKIKD
jgi:hypothetical protein